MFTTINENDFIQAFKKDDKYPYNQFTHEALQELFRYYEVIEDCSEEQIELDVIAICCEWTEYESEYELVNEYDMSIKGGLDEILEKTTVIKFTGEGNIGGNFTHYLVMNF